MIEAYLLAFNEEETIHLSISHYQKFCARVNILNNFSTDKTVEIAKSMGCKIINFGTPGILNDRDYIDIKNNCWKESKADWVVVCDCDEILLPPLVHKTAISLNFFLPDKYGTIFKTIGFNIFSHEMPKKSWREIDTGIFEENYNKTVIFNPKEITDINFHIGSHMSSPKGNVKWSDDQLYLFHYRNVGGPQRLVDRHNLYRPRMSKENLERRWGAHYLYTDEQRIAEWEEKYSRSKPFAVSSLVGS